MNTMNEITIVDLENEQKYLKEVSEWIWKECSKENGAKLEDVIYRTRHSINKNDIPKMFIAKHNSEVIGVVSLWVNDLKSRQDLFPWMATLYVKKDYRNKGLGGQILEKAIAQVYEDFGKRSIALGCHKENVRAAQFYERHGFVRTGVFERDDEYFLRFL